MAFRRAVAAVSLVLVSSAGTAASDFKLQLPLGLQEQAAYVPDDNALTAEKIALGKQLGLSALELGLSYFDGYFNAMGKRTMRSFTVPVDLEQFESRGWRFASDMASADSFPSRHRQRSGNAIRRERQSTESM